MERSHKGKKAPGENGLCVFCQQQNHIKYNAVLCLLHACSSYGKEVVSQWKTSMNSISEIRIQINIFQEASGKTLPFWTNQHFRQRTQSYYQWGAFPYHYYFHLLSSHQNLFNHLMLKMYFKSSTEVVLEAKASLYIDISLYNLAMISVTKMLLHIFLNTSTLKLASTMWSDWMITLLNHHCQ